MDDTQHEQDRHAWSRRAFLTSVVLAAAGTALGPAVAPLPARADTLVGAARALPSRKRIVARFGKREPAHFGLFLRRTVTRGKRRIALTFDACGGRRGSDYDEKLVETLRRHAVPATLFLNARWIEAFPTVAAELAADPLFELGNHGSEHRPLTVRGQSAYGIAGTQSAGAVYDEIVRGMEAVGALTGSRPLLFRPGTAWADDVGVAIARAMGTKVVSFGINVDEGATASRKTITRNLGRARSRSITLAHVNHPEGKTAEGLARALPRMLDEGRRFVTVSEAIR